MNRKQRFKEVISWFEASRPVAQTELQFLSPYQLIVAVILSAQCTDKRVNMTTPALFERFPDIASLAGAGEEELYGLIKSISYPNSKTRHPCPPENMTPAQQDEVARDALAYAKKVGAENLVRVDVIVRSSDGKVFVLEGNGLPGMTPTSLVPTEAKTAGISMTELCSSLVESAARSRR